MFRLVFHSSTTELICGLSTPSIVDSIVDHDFILSVIVARSTPFFVYSVSLTSTHPSWNNQDLITSLLVWPMQDRNRKNVSSVFQLVFHSSETKRQIVEFSSDLLEY